MRHAVLALLIVACGATQTDPPERPSGVPPRADGGPNDSGDESDGGATSTFDGSGDGTTVVAVDDAGVDARVDGAECTSSSSIAAPASPGSSLALAAYSLIGFSDTQGKCGWSYGYVAPATSGAFVLMGEYDGPGESWYVQNGVYWTFISRSRTHPNGVTTSGGRTAVDHWAVRRWTANYTGAVRITGSVKKSAGTASGNGIVARLMIGANEMFEQTIADEAGQTFDVAATVALGQAIDFVVDPNASEDGADSTDVIVAIWR